MKLYVTIDFYDEMTAAVWTPARLKKYFTLLHSNGIERIYWIDQLEIMKYSIRRKTSENIKATLKNFDNKIAEKAIEFAHELGMEIFVLIKPYEMGIQVPEVSQDVPEDLPYVPVVGCQLGSVTKFGIEHPEVMIQRIPAPPHGDAESLTLNFSAPLSTDVTVKFFCSKQNSNYQLAESKIVPQGASNVSFKLPAGETFFILQIEDAVCGNIYKNIVTLYDKNGCQVPGSLAIQPLRYYKPTAYHLDHQGNVENILESGMLFDYFPGIPSGLYNSDMPPCCFFDFNTASHHALGVSLELNDRIHGFPNPENEVFQQFIQDWVTEDMQMGFDGLDLRISSHSSPLFWSDYGTGEAVRAARGNAHTELLRKVSGIVRNAGRIMSVHIEDFMLDSDAQYPCPMEIFWDYKRWIQEKLADEVTAKYIATDGFTNANFAMLRSCKAAGIPVNVCPFIHVMDTPQSFSAWSREAGVEAFNIYEAATVWQPEADGDGFYEINPSHVDKIRRVKLL